MKNLDAQIAQLETLSQRTAALDLPNRAELYEDLATEYDTAKSSLQEAISSTIAFLGSVTQVLTDKRNRLFESLALNVAAPGVAAGAVDRLNAVIQKHNQACDNFQNRLVDARQRLEIDLVAADLKDFLRLQDARRASITWEQQTGTEVRRLSVEIEKLESEILEHRKPAEELNDDLHKYLGHNELQLEVKETGYAITRNGAPAQALSEGEMTAISLLYFLKTLKDRRFDLVHGVIVLDDPVSSLDANALYLAFGFIRERCKDAAQIFILTHNFSFFRQVRNWFHHLKGQNKRDAAQRPARFYMLNCEHDGAQRCSSIQPLDPLLEQYESEYHYLFARIYREVQVAMPAGLEQNYSLPNMARRLLETFLAFRRPQVSGELWQKLKDVKFDEAKKLRIIRFLHTHSHSDTIGEPEHDPFLLGEAQSVLTDLLEFLADQDPDHFSAMIEIVAPAIENGSDK